MTFAQRQMRALRPLLWVARAYRTARGRGRFYWSRAMSETCGLVADNTESRFVRSYTIKWGRPHGTHYPDPVPTDRPRLPTVRRLRPLRHGLDPQMRALLGLRA